MSEKALVSIIIPTFNSGATVRRAAMSALGQSYKNIEVIVIDDGSEDDTIKIVNEISASDSRLRVILRPNRGVSSARNDGIIAAQGEWFMTLDADDYYDPGMVEGLYGAADRTDADTVMCGFRNIYSNGHRETFKVSEDYTDDKDSFIDNMMVELYDQHMISTHSNQIYKTEIARKNRILYNEQLSVNEDIDFVLRYLKHCDTIGVVKGVYLNYVQHVGVGESLINTFRNYGIASSLLVLRDCNELFDDISVSVKTIDAMNQRLFLHICSFVGLMYYMSGYSDKRRLAELRELCLKEDFDDLLIDMRSKGLKARAAHMLFMRSDIRAYDRLCRLLYAGKSSANNVEPVPDPDSEAELEALCREPYLSLGIYTDISGADMEETLEGTRPSEINLLTGNNPGEGHDHENVSSFAVANVDTEVIMAALEQSAEDSATAVEHDNEGTHDFENRVIINTNVTVKDIERVRELLDET